MAKKKGKHKKGKRMGAARLKRVNQDLLYLGAGTLIGAFGKKVIDWGLSKQTAVTIKQPVIDWGAAVVGGGAFALLHMPPFAKGIALGLGSMGAIDGAIAAGALHGVGALPPMVPFRPRPNMSGGVTKTPAVGGASANAYQYPKTPGVGRANARSKFYTGAFEGR